MSLQWILSLFPLVDDTTTSHLKTQESIPESVVYSRVTKIYQMI